MKRTRTTPDKLSDGGAQRMAEPDLRTYNWKLRYSRESGDPLTESYIPALQRCVRYDRKGGLPLDSGGAGSPPRYVTARRPGGALSRVRASNAV